MQEQKEKQYDLAIDIIRTISILAVIFVHTTTRTLEASNYNLNRFSWTLFLNQGFRFAVPLFFMISGFVLELNYTFHKSFILYLKKRLSRIFIPYIFWSLVYYYFVYKTHAENFFQAALKGDASYQLYFIPSLLIFYFIFPLIHRFYGFLSRRLVAISLLLLQIFILYLDYFVHPLSFPYPISIAFLNFSVFLLGVFAAHKRDVILKFIGKRKIFLVLITAVLAVYIFEEGKSGYLKTHNYLLFYSQWRPSVFIYTILVAGLLYYVFNKIQIEVRVVKTFSKLSFFVFFIHVLVLEIIWYTIGLNLFRKTQGRVADNFWYDPIFFIAVTTISFSVAYLVHKIPKLKLITG